MGPLNALISMTLGTGGLIFIMSWLTSVGDVTVFALCYGFFSGGGVYLIYREFYPSLSHPHQVLSLLSPTLVGYSQDISEIG